MTSLTLTHKQAKRVSLALEEMRNLLKSGENGVIDLGRMAG
jgi:hypothetical protein